MFGIGLPEMILIMALALIVVGPDKLPDLARSVAKGVLELKKTVSALKEDFAEENPFDSVKPELEEAADSIKKQLGEATPDDYKLTPCTSEFPRLLYALSRDKFLPASKHTTCRKNIISRH